MANKFTDYDMRKFAIKDTKDIYAFLDAVNKGTKQIEVIVKKLAMSNAAKDSVIKSLQRKGPAVSDQAQEEALEATVEETLEAGTPDTAKLTLIQRLKAAGEKEDEPEEETSAEPNEPLVEQELNSAVKDEVLDKVHTQGGDGDVEQPEDESRDEDEVSAKEDETQAEVTEGVRYRGYEKRPFGKGQTRYFMDNSLVKGTDIPEDIKNKLDELYG